jgi:hypothetical protein
MPPLWSAFFVELRHCDNQNDANIAISAET